ncbi:MAG TPA: TIGR03936 family radical SAM-associated protein, partial [Allocoleopsis sp.]
PVEIDQFQQKLAACLPKDIPLYRAEVVDLKTPSATQLLEQAEYLITVTVVASEDSANLSYPTPDQWQEWIEAVKAQETIAWEQTTKSGKVQTINLRDRLFDLALMPAHPELDQATTVLRFVGSCRNDGTLLKPEQVLYMLEQVAQREFRLLHTHRNQLFLAALASA